MNTITGLFLPTANKQLGNKYFLLECLGDGTHGWVYRAERLSDNQTVAVKIPKQLSAPERTLAEGKELLGIEPHSNVIQIFDMGKIPPEKELYAIEMEYFPSETLAQKLEHRSGHFGNTYERLFSIYEQVLEAVAYLASLETPISHGDIKPHNILIGQGDLVKLTDFGSSALPEEFYVRTRENGGTVLYSSPEFCDCASRKGSIEELIAGDIYSLGVLLYQLMTGRLPHDTQVEVRSHAPFAKPREINSSTCPEIENVILTCLMKAPTDRYASIEALKNDFIHARKRQKHYSPLLTTLEPKPGLKQDWSTDVVNALDEADYQKAAKIAAMEFQRSANTHALLMQFNALYQDERWSDFETLLNDISEPTLYCQDNNGPVLRIVAIKAMMKWRNLSLAQKLIEFALEYDPQSYDIDLCDASIAGMKADYVAAREKLEALNSRHPMTVTVLRRLLQVCEQLRDYHAASSYLRVLMRLLKND
ncbi:protein kinase, partial [Photobacterium sp. OFAV2-7]|uniref:protein kinase domain-containing protein n=1 Tax=Photobacterium sp. OFAV2-7 TaxID=2917748 RepID=UPI001EF45320